MSDAVGKFISLVGLVFPRPRFEAEGDEALWIGLLIRQLGHYSPEVLAAAADDITRTRNKKRDGAYFPEPSECIAACEKAKRTQQCLGLKQIAVDKAPTTFSPDRHRLALDLLGTSIGAEAFKGRWHGQLYDFAYRNARLPNTTEADVLRKSAVEVEQTVAKLERGDIDSVQGFPASQLAKLGRNVLARRDKIKTAVAGK